MFISVWAHSLICLGASHDYPYDRAVSSRKGLYTNVGPFVGQRTFLYF
jgi:hypothetical protein